MGTDHPMLLKQPGKLLLKLEIDLQAYQAIHKTSLRMRLKNSLEQLTEILAHLVLPEGPIVAAFGAPIVHGMADAFAREDFREAVGGATISQGPVPVIR